MAMSSFLSRLTVLGALSLSPLVAVAQTWVGGNGIWDSAINWSPATVPTGNATATITSGVVDLDGVQSVSQVNLIGGTLENGALDSTNGIFSTNGTLMGVYGGTSLSTSTGTTTMLGVNSYGGATYVNSGTLLAGNLNAFSVFSTLTVASGATVDLDGYGQTVSSLSGAGVVTNYWFTAATLTNINASSVFAGSLEDGFSPIGLTQNSPGNTLTISGLNTYTGATLIAAGTLQAGAPGAFSTNSTTTIASGGTLDLNGTAQQIATLYLNGGAIQNGALSGNGIISTGGTVSSISGTTSLITTAGTTTLLGTNAYTGATLINGSTVIGGSANAFSPTSQTVVAPGGTLDLGGMVQTIGNVTLVGGVLRGPGTLVGNLNNLSGAVDLSQAPGILNIHGTYSQGPAGADDALLQGLTVGSDYSQVAVSQSAALSGQLDVTTGGGFTLAAGDSFVLLTFATVSGDFSGLALNGTSCALSGKDAWNCGNGLLLTEQFSANALTLDVVNTSVPLPSGWTTLLGGCVGLLLLRGDSRRRAALSVRATR